MKTLLVLTLLAAAAADYRAAFSEALRKHSGHDGLTSQTPAALKLRYASFVAFAENVDRINSDPSLPFTAENNFFSILSSAERRAYCGFNASSHHREEPSNVKVSAVGAADQRDFRNRISGVKDQGNCGSCWTFAATAALEGEMFFKSGATVALSEQEYLDCASSGGDGCNGGWMENAYTYSANYDRIAPMSAAPYQGQDNGWCQYYGVENALANVKVTGNQNIYGDAELLEYASSHIVSVAIKVSNDFMSYRSGVLVDGGCQSQPDHAVAVVGYGVKSGRKYWTIRNSWGVGWGDEGYVLLNRDVNNICKISDYSHIPVVACRYNNCNTVDPDDADQSDGEEEDEEEDGEEGGDCWGEKQQGQVLAGKMGKRTTLNKAKKACARKAACKGVYKDNNKFFLADTTTTRDSKNKNYAVVRVACGDQSDDSDGTCPTNTVWCWSCSNSDGTSGCCMHIHMCHD